MARPRPSPRAKRLMSDIIRITSRNCLVATLGFFLGFAAQVLVAQDPPRELDEEQAARQEWFYGQRAFPLSSIPAGARLTALRELNRVDQAARIRRQQTPSKQPGESRLALTTDSANWTQIGPQPTGGGTYAPNCGQDQCDRRRSSRQQHRLYRRGGRWRMENDRRRRHMDPSDGPASIARQWCNRDRSRKSRHNLCWNW